jgi:hypothetical protein
MPSCSKMIEYIRLPIGGTSRTQLSAMWAYTPSSDSGGHCGMKKAGTVIAFRMQSGFYFKGCDAAQGRLSFLYCSGVSRR